MDEETKTITMVDGKVIDEFADCVKVKTPAGEVVLKDPPASLALEYGEMLVEVAKNKDKQAVAAGALIKCHKWARTQAKKAILKAPKGLDIAKFEEWPSRVVAPVMAKFGKFLELEPEAENFEKK